MLPFICFPFISKSLSPNSFLLYFFTLSSLFSSLLHLAKGRGDSKTSFHPWGYWKEREECVGVLEGEVWVGGVGGKERRGWGVLEGERTVGGGRARCGWGYWREREVKGHTGRRRGFREIRCGWDEVASLERSIILFLTISGSEN